MQLNCSVRNVSFCQKRYSHILNVDAPVFDFDSNGHNKLSFKYNIYTKVFIPAGLNLVHDRKYVNNAGYVVNCSLGHGLCDNYSTSTSLKVPDVSLISSHGTVHLNVIQELDNFHTSCGSSERVSSLISIHDNSYGISFDDSNPSYIFNVLHSDTYPQFQHTLWKGFNEVSLCNRFSNDNSCLHISSSLVDGEGCLQGGYALAISSDEDLSHINGQPGVLVEIPQH